MNKGRRHELKMLKYKRRISRFLRSFQHYHNRKGEVTDSPKVIDILEDNGQLHYRTTSSPCSCFACQQPERQYNRAQVKRSFSIEDVGGCVTHLTAMPKRDLPYFLRRSIPL